MGSKTISITEEVYVLLKSVKLPHETFSDTIARLCKRKTLRGALEWLEDNKAWGDMNKEEEKELLEGISLVLSGLNKK